MRQAVHWVKRWGLSEDDPTIVENHEKGQPEEDQELVMDVINITSLNRQADALIEFDARVVMAQETAAGKNDR